ncbi:hypothetical protein SH589_10560 [Klebsiella aerogenes]|nr:hypothetical protein SH589_10560 [Klebsiella aerogenes]
MDKPIFMVIAAVILQKRVSNIAIQDKKKALLHMGSRARCNVNYE